VSPRLSIVATLVLGVALSSGCRADELPLAAAAPLREPEPIPAPMTEAAPASEASDLPGGQPEPRKAASLELTFVGDVVLGRYLASDRFAEMYPPEQDPFAHVRAQLAADVVVGNLESPVVSTLPARSPSRHRNRFSAAAAHVDQLARAGFSVMSLANNHYFDLGVPGQLESPTILRDAGILAVGASRTEGPLIRLETLETRGWRIGFIAVATRENSSGDPSGPRLPLLSLQRIDREVAPLVAAARADHDLVIVAVHWGDEYVDEPGRSRQIAARRLLAAGVDLVIGHHPHVLQAVELGSSSASGRDGLIAYSLGNFLFPRGDHPSGLSAVLRVRYQAGGEGQRPCLEQARIHPVVVARKPRWHPEAATGLAAEKVRRRLVSLSRASATRWQREGLASDPARGEDLLVEGLRACPSVLAQTQADAASFEDPS
jgi:hypothetical protein